MVICNRLFHIDFADERSDFSACRNTMLGHGVRAAQEK